MAGGKGEADGAGWEPGPSWTAPPCRLPALVPGERHPQAKYNVFSFLPLNLYQQFHRMSSLYFLLIIILQVGRVGQPQGSVPVPTPLLLPAQATSSRKPSLPTFPRGSVDPGWSYPVFVCVAGESVSSPPHTGSTLMAGSPLPSPGPGTQEALNICWMLRVHGWPLQV